MTDDHVSLDELADAVDRIDANQDGLVARLARLADRVDELEQENERLRSELRLERSESVRDTTAAADD
jgi:cell shape-determining protein MreC